MPHGRTTWLGLAVLLASVGAYAQDEDDAQIRNAVRRGVQFLKGQQNPDGSWSYPGHELGITSLAGLALIENGVTVQDPVIQKALKVVRGAAPSNAFTYDISLAILFLVRVADKSDNELILELGERLAGGQLSTGGWTYVCPLVPRPPRPASVSNSPRPSSNSSPPAKRPGRLAASVGRSMGAGDNSNTQFAVLGVWAAGRAGLDVTETMGLVDKRFRGTQSGSGGWGYTGVGDSDAMTCAGLMSLALAKGQKVLDGQMSNRKADGDAPGARPKMESDAHIERGIRRVEFYANTIGPGSTLYFLWSVERVSVALGLKRLGAVDWYRRGANALLQAQQLDGGWRSNRGELADTSFALLFLHRSNLAEGMPQLVTGRSGENNMRPGSLDDLIRSVRPDPKSDPK
jgi:hypothetical protein